MKRFFCWNFWHVKDQYDWREYIEWSEFNTEQEMEEYKQRMFEMTPHCKEIKDHWINKYIEITDGNVPESRIQ